MIEEQRQKKIVLDIKAKRNGFMHWHLLTGASALDFRFVVVCSETCA